MDKKSDKGKINLLVLDDEPQWSTSLFNLIGDKVNIRAVSTYNEARSKLAGQPKTDVIFLDMMMSNAKRKENPKNTFNFIKYVKKNNPHMPIIGYSSYFFNREEILKNLGISVVLDKNDKLTPDHLYELLEKVVKDSKAYESPPSKATTSPSIEEIRNVLIDEMNRLSPLREKTLVVPNEGQYELIKPLIGYKRDIENKISQYPFANNVFLMMKFRQSNRDLSEFIIETLNKHGLNGVRADQTSWSLTKNVYNPIAVLYCCKYGIALFDDADEDQAYSPNVAYELGIMHYQNKGCLILRHSSLPAMPFDLIKDLYVTYEKDLQVRKIVEDWTKQITE
jgi:DNA-binding NarL/FixJ family response regulator